MNCTGVYGWAGGGGGMILSLSSFLAWSVASARSTLERESTVPACEDHRWELPGNYPVFTVVIIIYHYVERIWGGLITPNFLYNIYNH